MTISLNLEAHVNAVCKVLNRAIQEYHHLRNRAKLYRAVRQSTCRTTSALNTSTHDVGGHLAGRLRGV